MLLKLGDLLGPKVRMDSARLFSDLCMRSMTYTPSPMQTLCTLTQLGNLGHVSRLISKQGERSYPIYYFQLKVVVKFSVFESFINSEHCGSL